MFELNHILRADSNANLNDVGRIKMALARIGHFEAPGYGQTPFLEQSQLDGIKSFQRVRGTKDRRGFSSANLSG